MFVKVTHAVLRRLQSQGYNILTSVNTIDDENPTYMPEKVDDVWEFLDSVTVVPFEEPEILVIEEALNNIMDDQLIGAVWVSNL